VPIRQFESLDSATSSTGCCSKVAVAHRRILTKFAPLFGRELLVFITPSGDGVMVKSTALMAAAAGTIRTLKTPLLVVALSALLALLITVVTRPDPRVEAAPAGSAEIERLHDEHALVAEYTQTRLEAEQAAVDIKRNEMRISAIAAETPQVVAMPASKPLHLARAVAPAQKNPADAVGPPLQLQASSPPPAPARQAGVIGHAREALAAAQRIPGWVGAGVRDAAEWAIGPVQSIAHLERRFL
jgi:hypothetical protein